MPEPKYQKGGTSKQPDPVVCVCGFHFSNTLENGVPVVSVMMGPVDLYWNCPALALHQSLLARERHV